ncbi:1,2-phenylacetyl-CoA epoxidase subunit PaaD [Roseateles sp. BYS180W]|uniref:1,2-phenylacetyl-CoA epoxidase subunit PaaD n=1 Tax=Roseateles rivi TaxID=3299028 RepID=A0ABW7FY99_9BURK
MAAVSILPTPGLVPVAAPRVAAAWEALRGVMDPEVPVISLVELGIVREVRELHLSAADAHDAAAEPVLEVVLTPTYSGCPATELIQQLVQEALAPWGPVRISLQRAPAWTTDWIDPQGLEKLRAYGIAPPGPARCGTAAASAEQPLRFHRRASAAALACPRCGSHHTEQLSAFGSTACKALHRCLSCLEPFEHFKPI